MVNPQVGQLWTNRDGTVEREIVGIEYNNQENHPSPRIIYRQDDVYRTCDIASWLQFSKWKSDLPAVRKRSKEFQDVYDFHKKFELMLADMPRLLTKRKLIERIEFMKEELDEFVDGCGVFHPGAVSDTWAINPDAPQDLAQQADALGDLVYVALGTAVMLGLPWDWLWDDIQRANMAKVRGVTKRGHKVDVTKPPGWEGPQTERILGLAGFNPATATEHDDA